MSSAQKTPFARTIPRLAQRMALDEIAKRGQALPGHVIAVDGPIVTVNFDVQGVTLPQVAMPLFGPEYIRYPIQPQTEDYGGDLGVAFPADVYLGGVSGLGGGTADDTRRGNLSTLVWFPIGNKNWAQPPGGDADTHVLYGKTALLLLDSIAGNSALKLTASGITLTFGSASITMNSSAVTIAFGGHSVVCNSSGVTIDGKSFLPHIHTGGTISGDTGGVV